MFTIVWNSDVYTGSLCVSKIEEAGFIWSLLKKDLKSRVDEYSNPSRLQVFFNGRYVNFNNGWFMNFENVANFWKWDEKSNSVIETVE